MNFRVRPTFWGRKGGNRERWGVGEGRVQEDMLKGGGGGKKIK